MKKERLEAFSDGVLAIIITIMVLGLKVPKDVTLEALLPLSSSLFCYLISFIFLGIYWTNHHHLFQAINRVDGRVLWANLHLLFWLSLIPFVTAWVGENGFAPVPTALYGVIFLLAAIAYFVLTRTLIALHGHDSVLARAVGSDFKGKISVILYFVSIPTSFVSPKIAFGLFVVVAFIWLVPDRRIENLLGR